MRLHANPRLSVKSRELLVERLAAGWSLTEVAAAAESASPRAQVARPPPGRGSEGLLDRSLTRKSVPSRTPEDRIEAIAALRRLRLAGPEIAELFGMALSTVSGILTRIGMGKLGRLGLEPPRRYERERPGELRHVDVKKLGRIRGSCRAARASAFSSSRSRPASSSAPAGMRDHVAHDVLVGEPVLHTKVAPATMRRRGESTCPPLCSSKGQDPSVDRHRACSEQLRALGRAQPSGALVRSAGAATAKARSGRGAMPAVPVGRPPRSRRSRSGRRAPSSRAAGARRGQALVRRHPPGCRRSGFHPDRANDVPGQDPVRP
jgi:leucine-zipper of insertion element IS481